MHLFALVGLALITVGVALIWIPAGIITAGVALVVVDRAGVDL